MTQTLTATIKAGTRFITKYDAPTIVWTATGETLTLAGHLHYLAATETVADETYIPLANIKETL